MGIIYICAACWALVYGEKHHALTTNLLKRTTPDVHLIANNTINPVLNSSTGPRL